MLGTSKLILAIVCGSYLLSAALLGIARLRGQSVPVPVIATWALLGLLGFVLLPSLQPGRWIALGAMLVVLGPWMAYSLWGDVRGGHWAIAVTDVLGLGAIGYATWIIRR